MGKRILIVDDKETIFLFLRDSLEKLGFEMKTTSKGLEVLIRESVNWTHLDLECRSRMD